MYHSYCSQNILTSGLKDYRKKTSQTRSFHFARNQKNPDYKLFSGFFQKYNMELKKICEGANMRFGEMTFIY